MRNVLAGIACLLVAGALFGANQGCTQPNLVVTGIQGEMQAPCTGAIDFVSAQFSVSGGGSTTGSGAGSSIPGTLTVVKYFDMSSPALITDCLNGKAIQKVTLAYPSAQNPVTVIFENVRVATVNDSVNPTNETVEFKYSKVTYQTGGTRGTVATGNVMGTARASAMNVAVVGGDGNSTAATHVSLTVRPGGTTFNSVQLNPQPLPPKSTNVRAGMLKTSAPAQAALNLSNGAIEFRTAKGGVTRFQFTGGTLVNGNLRVSRATLNGGTFTGGVRPQ